MDYSYSGPMSGADAKAAGLSFVCRYVSVPGAGKNLRLSEVQDFTTNGIGVVVVFESGTSSALRGFPQGAADARSADAQVNALGLPACPIYFAVDFDAVPAQYAIVGQYLDGAISVLGLPRVGVYGGYYVVRYCLDNGHAHYAWQAIAWSDGLIDSRAHIYQSFGATVAGVNVDQDRTVSSDTDYGQADRTQEDDMPYTPEQLVQFNASGVDRAMAAATITGTDGQNYSLIQFIQDIDLRLQQVQAKLDGMDTHLFKQGEQGGIRDEVQWSAINQIGPPLAQALAAVVEILDRVHAPGGRWDNIQDLQVRAGVVYAQLAAVMKQMNLAVPAWPDTPVPAPVTTYTVAKGDTLGSIAAQFKTTVQALVDLNHILNPDNVAVGDVLQLPKVT